MTKKKWFKNRSRFMVVHLLVYRSMCIFFLFLTKLTAKNRYKSKTILRWLHSKHTKTLMNYPELVYSYIKRLNIFPNVFVLETEMDLQKILKASEMFTSNYYFYRVAIILITCRCRFVIQFKLLNYFVIRHFQ